MATIDDPEFGTVTIRRSARATHVKIRVAPDGRLRASLPLYAPIFMLRRLLKTSRTELRTILEDQSTSELYLPGQQIGKSHTLIARPSTSGQTRAHRHGQQIIIEHPSTHDFTEPDTQRLVRDEVIKALRIEAKSYLPKRLQYLAGQHGFTYAKVRFSHAGSRWGSCSSSGTISLNIALMKLPFELIDYVLIHELNHTRQMNHSQQFWALVEQGDPHYRTHRRDLKKQSPSI